MDGQAKSAGFVPIARPEFMSEVPPDQLGITVLHEEPNVKVDVVAVHGLGAIPEITWKEKTSGVNWLKDKTMLPSTVPKARIMRFGYDSMWLGRNPVRTNIRIIADNLLEALTRERKDCEDRPLIFIGHCFGGLVVEKALTTNSLLMRQRPGLFDSTIGVIFLGTPHSGTVTFTSRGVSTKAILTVIAMYSELRQDPEVLSGLESERGTLLEVSQDFLTLSRSPQGVNLQLINFFEQRSSKVGKQVGRDDLQEFVVDQASATLGSHPSYGLPLDHYSLNKFASSDDGNFKMVQGKIIELYNRALERDQINTSRITNDNNSVTFYKTVILSLFSLWLVGDILFGVINSSVFGGDTKRSVSTSDPRKRSGLPSTPESFSLFSIFYSVPLSSFFTPPDSHLLGEYTIHVSSDPHPDEPLSPLSTAQLNPHAHTFCLSPQTNNFVFIPILLNNTDVAKVRYTVTPLGYSAGWWGTSKIEHVELSSKDLEAIEIARVKGLRVAQSTTNMSLDVVDKEKDNSKTSNSTHTHSMAHILLEKPGILRLQSVMDKSNIEVRLNHSREIIVVLCPQADFTPDGLKMVHCAGQDLTLTIAIRGLSPLRLRWFKEVNGRREHFVKEGIESVHSMDSSSELAVSLDEIGRHVYAIEEVIDGVGNSLSISHPSTFTEHAHEANATFYGPNLNSTRSFSVIRPPAVSFKYCGPGSPTSLLIGSEVPLTIAVNHADVLDAPWEVSLKYQPPTDLEENRGKRLQSWRKNLMTPRKKKDLSFRASTPGDYRIVGVKGKWCEGDVLAPETCEVIEKPYPTADIEWRRIRECSGDTGVAASLILHGSPPFQVYYRTRRQDYSRDLVKTFSGFRGELTIALEQSGDYIHSFFQMSDANYKKVELNGPSIRHTVYAPAEFVHGGPREVDSCSRGMIDVEVDLKGSGPWNLEVQVVSPTGSETLQISEIKASRGTFQVPIPDIIDREGGSFGVELVSVEDSDGCMRSISVPGISVNVKRVGPTAKFYGKDGKRHVAVPEYDRAKLPLRLTGNGPWRVKYRRAELPMVVKTLTVMKPNDELNVVEDGLYEITEVIDSRCIGTAIANESTYRVDWIPRPSAKLAPETEAIYVSHNRSHILAPICEGLDDHIDLDLTGKAPFQVLCNLAQDDPNGGVNVLEQSFSSIQNRTRFRLQTFPAGRKYYEVKQIGDATYSLDKHNNTFTSRSEGLLFEQEVFTRPTARFRNNNGISYCLNDALVPRDGITDGQIQLEGTPPFKVQLSIKNFATGKVDTVTTTINEKTWTVSLPSYTFESISRHLITIESIQDALHCEQAASTSPNLSVWVEKAAIVPLSRRKDFCVGEISQFQMEGTPPWTIGYRLNGKSYAQQVRVSPFSHLHQRPGEFTITSVADHHKICQAPVTDFQFIVHPLPSAAIGHGKGIYQDIYEGDQAEIVFTLVGVPPFTFTYQRSEPSPKRGEKAGKVLETHTVSGVAKNEYSIYSALTGTWTVTSISDRYCRYPPPR